MIRSKRIKKSVALFFLGLLVAENILPLKVWALTSGPVQPESKQFQQAGTTDMVDLFTGDFKYNIPLLDVDGYPVNLSYQSGSGMDDEASWVGFGWSLNPGAITRQLRGLPDDFAGDQVVTQHYVKPKVVVGGRGTVRLELKGRGIGNIGGSLFLGVFSDNYTGIGAEVGANAGLSLSLTNGGVLTGRLGIGVNSNTSSGVNVSPQVSLAISNKMTEAMTASYAVSAQLGYNTRNGLKDLTLGQSFGLSGYDISGRNLKTGSANFDISSSSISYNTPPFYPSAGIAFKSKDRTYSLDVGGTAFALFAGGGLSGYKSVREVASADPIAKPAFGLLYAEQAAKQGGALMDFMREKDNPAIPNLPNLPMPIATPDLFSYSGQGSGGQFRLYRGGTGVFYDAATRDVSDNASAGGDFGYGGYFHGGVSFYNQDVVTQTGKWEKDNAFLSAGDFAANKKNPADEAAYFKQVGEKNLPDQNFSRRIVDEKPVAITLSGKSAQNLLRDDYNTYAAADAYKKDGRQSRRTTVTYLTAGEAAAGAIDRKIQSYAFNNYGAFNNPEGCSPRNPVSINREGGYRKKHHISEITVHNDNGGRSVYGIPVYNISQREMSFAIDKAKVISGNTDIAKNLIAYNTKGDGSLDNKLGIDHYLHDETQPAYASSYLLTGYLSPDYVDLTGDGISPDDNGTAVKFNYTKGVDYGWRTPGEEQRAALNRGQLADPDDDKGSIVFGMRESWYTHSIEGKNYIAYFVTEDRDDALGIADWKGAKNTAMAPKRLREIRLYKKGAVPQLIKTVVFEYDYSLCVNAPNHRTGAGKLTLKKIYFKYQSSTKGARYPYAFEYNPGPEYTRVSTDRWGVLKPVANNASDGFGALTNDEFPYATSNKGTADLNASAWQLSKIVLPTGGEIKPVYESDDYSYVQDRRAMQMTKITRMLNIKGDQVFSLADAKALRISIPGVSSSSGADRRDWFIQQYLDGKPYLYAKLSVDVTDNPGNNTGIQKEFIPAYGKVIKVVTGDGYADVYFEDQQESGGVNPFQFAAWQKMRLEYPRYAFPGYRNRISDDAPIQAALSAIVNAIGNLSELKENFYQRAQRKGFGSLVDLDRSFARIVKADGFKLGGGTRVKKIVLSDSWNSMVQGGTNATYGQSYEYTTEEGGRTISSGVASYEPYIGGDENPMRQPVNYYTQEMKWALSNYFYLEEPFGESLYPAPVVGYRRVTTRSLNEQGEPDLLNKTGRVIDEFYTAKEYPVSCTYTSPRTWNYQPASWFSFFGGQITHEMVMSQGYAIQLNDMHGKPKAQRILNQSGAEISSTVYHYNSERMGANTYRLANKVSVVNDKGQITRDQIIGREIEMYTDMREQETSNTGRSINIGLDVIPFFFGIALPIPHWPTSSNDEYRLFRSASTLKTVQYYGILDKVVKTVNGSSITTNNLLYDQLTGDPVVVQQENEFGDPVYQVNMPAYWKYDKMGGAYKNEGLLMIDLKSDNTGAITNAPYESSLNPGDELIDLKNSSRMWVVKAPISSGNTTQILRLVRADGSSVLSYTGNVKVYHSAYRNQLQPGTLSIVCKQMPYNNNKLSILDNAEQSAFRIVDAKATLFNEEWSMSSTCNICPPGYTLNSAGDKCVGAPTVNNDSDLNVCTITKNANYGISGGRFYTESGTVYNNREYWAPACVHGGDNCSPLNRYGVWLCVNQIVVHGTWLGMESCLTVPETGWYSLGYGVSTDVRIYIDGTEVKGVAGQIEDNYKYWNVRPIYLTAGKKKITIESVKTADNNAVAVEIYKGLPADIMNLNFGQVQDRRIFSTESLAGSNVSTYVFTIYTNKQKYQCSAGIYDVCTGNCVADASNTVNPYLLGFLGNWRPVEEKVFKVGRDNNQAFASIGSGANVRHSGYYTNFTPYWYPDQAGLWQPVTVNGTAWTTARYVTLYGKQGEELENRDVLGRYSGARYGFYNAVPLAVSSNAMNREIFYDGFEDDVPGTGCLQNICDPDVFSIRKAILSNSTGTLDVSNAHTGNFSLKLTGPLGMQSLVHTMVYGSQSYLDNSSGVYKLKGVNGLYPAGFSPLPNKKYVFSAWVKDNQSATSTSTGITATINGVNIVLQRRAMVEGWKLVEGIMDLSAIGSATNFTVNLSPQGTVWVDDIRIFPFDGQLKSYAYDSKTLRLMAELDENNFATFYEYDDEGSLIRLKKETDRGIMTLKENRSAFRRNQ